MSKDHLPKEFAQRKDKDNPFSSMGRPTSVLSHLAGGVNPKNPLKFGDTPINPFLGMPMNPPVTPPVVSEFSPPSTGNPFASATTAANPFGI